MAAELRLVDAPETLWRVELASRSLDFAHINAVDAAGAGGNRFDVPGAGVLYAATAPAGSFAETLARFRPSTDLLLKMKDLPDDGLGLPGDVDSSWRSLRRLKSVRLVEPLKFVDVDHPSTHTFLTEHAASELLGVGVKNLDVAILRSADRRITRAIAAWIYSNVDEHDRSLYSGIRYASRLGDYECWAIFDGTEVQLDDEVRLEDGHPDLETVAQTFGLRFT